MGPRGAAPRGLSSNLCAKPQAGASRPRYHVGQMADLTPFGKLILVVDDEPVILRYVTSTLAHQGYRVMVAENGASGLELFLAHPDEIDLILSDVVMPVMDGIRMVQEIRQVRPDVRVLLMTAYSDAVIQTLSRAEFPIIRKPFLAEDVVRAVEAALNPPAARA